MNPPILTATPPSRAHEQFRWFGGGWAVSADLPTPAGFAAASQFVRPDDVVGSIACGPDLDELAESVRHYVDAGFTAPQPNIDGREYGTLPGAHPEVPVVEVEGRTPSES